MTCQHRTTALGTCATYDGVGNLVTDLVCFPGMRLGHYALIARLLTGMTFTNRLRGEEEVARRKSSSARGTVGRHGEGEGREIENDRGGDGRCKLWENLQQPLYFGQSGPRAPVSTPSTPPGASNDAAIFAFRVYVRRPSRATMCTRISNVLSSKRAHGTCITTSFT